MSVTKKVVITTLSLILALCLAINCWYFYILIVSPSRVVSNTMEVGLQTTTNGESKYFVEINSYADVFEIKFNYFLDTDKNAFYSQGLQFIADENGEIQFNFTEETDEFYQNEINNHGWWGWEEGTFQRYIYGVSNDLTYNYMSGDDYDSTIISTNPITTDTAFKIELGDNDYLMKFKGYNIGYVNEAGRYLTRKWGSWMDWTVIQYYSADAYYFAKLLYTGISSLPAGTNHACIFEFGDLFDYYKEGDTPGVYDELVTTDEATLIYEDIKSYYSILVNKSNDKMTSASQSLFNCYAGNSNYNVFSDSSGNYFIGRTVINVGYDDFDLVELTDDVCLLKLDESFIDLYLPSKDLLLLDVLVNLDVFESIEIVGFSADCNLDEFNVISCQFVETVDGELVYSEVPYDF